MTTWSRTGVDTGHKTQHGINGNDRAAAVTDQGESQTDNGQNADAHADVTGDLEDQCRSGTEAGDPAHIVRTFGADPNASGNNGYHQENNQETAQKAQFFTDGRKYKVSMLSVQRADLGAVAVE